MGTLPDVNHDIACRTGLRCAPLIHVGIRNTEIRGAVRLGTGPFITKAHIETAIEGVTEMAEFSQR